MEKTDDSIKEIIQKAKKGNQIAFSTLLDTFWNDVYSFQILRTKNENDAEDITIRTFSRAFDRIETYDDAFEFKTWLITISKNLHVDLLRKRKRSLLNDMDSRGDEVKRVLDETPSVEDRLITEQNLANLLRDIKKLKPHYQKVINLRYFHELSYADIAKELNEPINNVKVKLLRAKKLLAEVIKKNCPVRVHKFSFPVLYLC
ncbi:RNA polymerase sigma factor [Allomuricauda sp. F6463D]|uniref:RNA polymerase sigma factor n=1 Tax=Allomuricauda sp. F6463D TaxID=2926409 RepID=UPI001FF64BFF|nr:RNA polymerase sigma factor [Muricauda sp. F6463D]MCK0161890.1 RNA polymerase sigma factor [Muricauda sp. F6463D]